MHLDLSTCVIRVPTGEALPPLYEFLSACFPSDRAVFDEMTRIGKTLYTWTPYTLYRGNEILGNVSLMPMRVWLDGRTMEVSGIASVATAPRYRRQGVARLLMRHVLDIVDARQQAGVLFTGLPEAYQGAGFQAVSQRYLAVQVSRMNFSTQGFEGRLVTSLVDTQLSQLARIYAEQYPNYDGKVDRDPEYWQLYAMLFKLSSRSRFLLGVRRGEVLGYTRFDRDHDRLTICELCAAPSAPDVAVALLGLLGEQAAQSGVDLLTFALPPDHFAWSVLQQHAIPLCAEPPGVTRETFMVRPARDCPRPSLFRLQWSLADKF
jgi:GNAT superfamily N-acetyltransferase